MGLAVAIEIARVRGAAEGFAKWVATTKNYSPWEMGQDIQEGADNAENQAVIDWEMRRQRDKNQPKPQPYSPGVGDVANKGAADKARQEAIRQLEQDQKKIEEDYRRNTEALQREYSLQIISSQTYTKNLIDDAEDRYKKLKESLDKQLALEKDQSGKDKVRNEIQKAEDDLNKTKQQATDEQDKREIDALKAHREALLKLGETYDAESIAAIESNADLGAITYEEAENRKFDIQTKAYDRRLQAVIDDEQNYFAALKDAKDADVAVTQKFSDTINQIQEDQEKAQQEHDRRVDEERRKDIERERQYHEAIKQLRERAVNDGLSLRRSEVEAAQREAFDPALNTARPTNAQQKSLNKALADADRDIENERHTQVMKALDDQEAEAKRQAVLHHQIFIEEETYHRMRENENRKHALKMAEIQAEQNDADKKADPLKGAIDQLKQTTAVTDFLSQQAANGLNQMTDAFEQAIEANILYGDSIGKAMKTALAEYLAHVSGEATIEALRQAAWAVAMLAEGNFASAAKHAEAAALFGALAVASGVAGSALAKSAGMHNNQTATSGSSAGQAIASTAPTPNNQTFTYHNTAQPSGIPGVGNSGVGEIVNRLDRLERAVVESSERNTRLIATATERNTQALSTIESADFTDLLVKSSKTTNGQRAIGRATHNHLMETHSFRRAIAQIAEGYGPDGPGV